MVLICTYKSIKILLPKLLTKLYINSNLNIDMKRVQNKNQKRTYLVSEYNQEKKIEGLAFIKSGEFLIVDNQLKLKISKTVAEQKHVVYIHLIDGKIVYVGETSRTLRERMILYIIHSGQTNVRVRTHIKKRLLKGSKCEIFSFKPEIIIINNKIKINPYISIEQALIKNLGNPLLNRKNVG